VLLNTDRHLLHISVPRHHSEAKPCDGDDHDDDDDDSRGSRPSLDEAFATFTTASAEPQRGAAIRTLYTLLHNLCQHPDNEKFQKIRTTNPVGGSC
jgi:hypothetical protein